MSVSKYIDTFIRILKIEFVLEGITVSFWQIILFLIIASILVYLIGGLLR